MSKLSDGVCIYYCRNCVQGKEAATALLRLEVREEVMLEPVPCTGRIDPRYLLKAFENGARAVGVLGCADGHCRLIEGNLRASRRVHAVRELLAEAGIDPESVRLFLPGGSDEAALRAEVESIRRFAASRPVAVGGMVAG